MNEEAEPLPVTVTQIELAPEEAECANGVGISMVVDTPVDLINYCWQFRYMVDTSKKRITVQLGNSPWVSYGSGQSVMSHTIESFNLTEVPVDVLQKEGLLKAILTGQDGNEVLTVTFVVKIYYDSNGSLRRLICNPLA
mmetsp:Transcript_66704/g.104213  ORF Transcript_66704/g.104213 Transcript_66704/m.104213 type:complete len:139 (+) Transcript_66704:95-511(+)